jgi:hypothetical protein
MFQKRGVSGLAPDKQISSLCVCVWEVTRTQEVVAAGGRRKRNHNKVLLNCLVSLL